MVTCFGEYPPLQQLSKEGDILITINQNDKKNIIHIIIGVDDFNGISCSTGAVV
jgi:hypothetical protein